jgi:nitroreductase
VDGQLKPEFEGLRAVAEARRSARSFLPEPIPEAVLDACFDVAIARPDLWRLGAERMFTRLETDAREGTADADYRAWLPRLKKKYELMVPLLFADGPLNVLAPAKAALLWVIGLFRPMMRGPFGRAEQQLWATKTTALACENFMLALAAAGYDSCPLEGFDEPKLKRLLALTHEARVVMVIAAGRRGPHALIPQIRHERAFYVERV